MACIRTARCERAPDGHRHGRGAGDDERLLLHLDRPPTSRHGGGDRVPPGDRIGRSRSAHGAKRARPRLGRRRGLPAHRRPHRRGAARRRLRLRQRRPLRPLHRPRSPHRAEQADERDRRSRRGDAGRLRRHRSDRGLERCAGAARPDRSRGRDRRRDLLVGHPLRLRPARDGEAEPRHVLADGLAAAGNGDGRSASSCSPRSPPRPRCWAWASWSRRSPSTGKARW